MEDKKYETECKCDSKKAIRGITCDARNCAYNDGTKQCCAGQVNVGPMNADCSSETVCATFRHKTY